MGESAAPSGTTRKGVPPDMAARTQFQAVIGAANHDPGSLWHCGKRMV
jgi:hypothetical protein